MGETAVLMDGEKEFQNLCRLPREIFEEIVEELCTRAGLLRLPRRATNTKPLAQPAVACSTRWCQCACRS